METETIFKCKLAKIETMEIIEEQPFGAPSYNSRAIIKPLTPQTDIESKDFCFAAKEYFDKLLPHKGDYRVDGFINGEYAIVVKSEDDIAVYYFEDLEGILYGEI